MPENEYGKPKANFQDRVIYFMGNVDATLTNIDKRLTIIEGNIGGTCPAHTSIVQLLSNQKDANSGQGTQNMEVQRQQKVQDNGIRDLQEQGRFIEYKISNRDLAKLSAIIIPVTTIILFIMERMF